MFQANEGNGVKLTFPNGYAVSIQWGRHNYCHIKKIQNPVDPSEHVSAAASVETAIIGPDGEFVSYKGDDVQAYQNLADVLKTLNYVAGFRKEETLSEMRQRTGLGMMECKKIMEGKRLRHLLSDDISNVREILKVLVDQVYPDDR